MKKKDKYLLILFLIISLIWTILVYFNVFANVDSKFYKLVIGFKGEILTNIFKIITFLCSVKFMVSICIVLGITAIIKKKKIYGFPIFIIVISSVVNSILKYIIRRERPDKINWLINESNFSFPSGHSMMAVLFYGFLGYIIYKSKINNIFKYILLFIISILILMIGISRVYLGVHYFSDIIGGFLWGFTLFIIIIYIGKKGEIL